MTGSEEIQDSGERILPTKDGEVSIIYSRHRFVYEYIRQFVKDQSVIDIGCGAGYGSKILSEVAREVLALDHDQEAISYCRNNYRADNLVFAQSDIMDFEPATKYDIVVSLQVIEHFDDVSNFLEKIKTCVKDGGTVFISTPNVPPSHKNRNGNKYHLSEMDYSTFRDIIKKHFSKHEILGIANANDNVLRKILNISLIYELSRKIKRNSKIKNVACKALDLTRFKIISSNVQKEAADLLAVCENS